MLSSISIRGSHLSKKERDHNNENVLRDRPVTGHPGHRGSCDDRCAIGAGSRPCNSPRDFSARRSNIAPATALSASNAYLRGDCGAGGSNNASATPLSPSISDVRRDCILGRSNNAATIAISPAAESSGIGDCVYTKSTFRDAEMQRRAEVIRQPRNGRIAKRCPVLVGDTSSRMQKSECHWVAECQGTEGGAPPLSIRGVAQLCWPTISASDANHMNTRWQETKPKHEAASNR
jgi:hypothetical protein